jgi:hypothetical protein
MSQYADWFVGGVAIAIGAGALWGAASANRYVFEMPKLRLLESSIGKTPARAILALAGVGLITLGIGIALDWKWPWKAAPRETVERSRASFFCKRSTAPFYF